MHKFGALSWGHFYYRTGLKMRFLAKMSAADRSIYRYIYIYRKRASFLSCILLQKNADCGSHIYYYQNWVSLLQASVRVAGFSWKVSSFAWVKRSSSACPAKACSEISDAWSSRRKWLSLRNKVTELSPHKATVALLHQLQMLCWSGYKPFRFSLSGRVVSQESTQVKGLKLGLLRCP